MKTLLLSMKYLWDQVSFVRTSADRLVTHAEGFLISAHLSSDGVGVATAVIYDGDNTQGDIIRDLAAMQGGNDNFCPPVAIPFNKGLYIDVGSNVASVTVVFILRRK
jgi:hypothetical protein